MFYLRLPNISKNLALMSFSRSAYAKSCDGFVPQETDFKRLALVLSSASACKKLAMVSSLKTMFQKRPMAPTFLSSSATRRHNNARPPPAHTLLSAAAERSSYGYPVRESLTSILHRAREGFASDDPAEQYMMFEDEDDHGLEPIASRDTLVLLCVARL